MEKSKKEKEKWLPFGITKLDRAFRKKKDKFIVRTEIQKEHSRRYYRNHPEKDIKKINRWILKLKHWKKNQNEKYDAVLWKKTIERAKEVLKRHKARNYENF
jgi:hypothetical protein